MNTILKYIFFLVWVYCLIKVINKWATMIKLYNYKFIII